MNAFRGNLLLRHDAGMSGTRPRDTGVLQSVERALRVLDHVAASPTRTVPAKEVARALGLPLPTTYHLLTTLVRSGYLVHDVDERGYAVGHRVTTVARGMRRQIAPPDGVERVVNDCHHQAAAASYYAYLRQGEMVVAHVSDCERHPRIEVLEVGFAEADHATAFGKLMLAFLDADAQEDRLLRSALQPITPKTVTDPQILRRQLQQVRARGLAIEIDEFQPRLSCMAAPVTDAVGRFVGAVAISTSTEGLRSRRWDVERVVRSAATRATRAYALARAVRGPGVTA